jgi:hypothetical protein
MGQVRGNSLHGQEHGRRVLIGRNRGAKRDITQILQRVGDLWNFHGCGKPFLRPIFLGSEQTSCTIRKRHRRITSGNFLIDCRLVFWGVSLKPGSLKNDPNAAQMHDRIHLLAVEFYNLACLIFCGRVSCG